MAVRHVEASVKDFGTRCNLVVLLLLLATMLGCSALNASQPSTESATGSKTTGVGSGQISATPKNVAFGNVQLGKTQTQSVSLSNSGKGVVTITHASISEPEFVLTGLKVPFTLKAGQKVSIGVNFTPAAGGSETAALSLSGTTATTFAGSGIKRRGAGTISGGTITDVAVTVVPTSLSVPVSGIGMGSGELAVSPAVLALGNVKVGSTQTQSATLINSGSTSVTISHASVTGRGFKMSGLSFPLKLSPGQKKTFSITFTPQSAGTSTGSVAVTSDAPNSVVSVPVSGVAIAAGSLVSNPASLSFGSVPVSSPKTLSGTLTNSSGTSITISQASITGGSFVLSGLNLPGTLDAGQSVPFSVTFTPQGSGTVTGSLAVISTAANAMLTVPLTATTATGGVLSTSDSSLDFAVQLGSTGTQSETLTNTGGSSVTGFKATGLTLPLTLAAGQSFTFGATFTPTSGASTTGSISVVSNASNPSLTISLAGSATVSGQLAVSPATLSFGNITVGQSKSLSGSLTATGSSITVSNASMSTAEFTVSGITLPLTLAAGKSVLFTVTFAPQASGTASANASFASNASNPSAQQSLTGSGAAAPQHSVALSWNPSSSSVVGYNVYRGVKSGGPYSQINALNATTTDTDSSVQAGQTYFYVTTAVDATGKESVYSNETQAVIPTP
jgi:hypothetical protein